MDNSAISDILDILCTVENKIDVTQQDISKIKETMVKINATIVKINATMVEINDRIASIEEKIENTNKQIQGEVLEENKKMGSHIDFVENVYENVKHPLGYICKKIKGIAGNNTTYELTNKQ